MNSPYLKTHSDGVDIKKDANLSSLSRLSTNLYLNAFIKEHLWNQINYIIKKQ